MENGLSLDLGLGDGFRAVKSEEIGPKIRETQRDQEMHGEEYFLKLSLRSVICEQKFSNVEESMKERNIKRALSIEEVDQIPAVISSSSNIKSSEAQSKNDLAIEMEKDDGVARKKLRLTRDQAAFLEESFKKHSTLNPKQKLALSKKLNLKPRQVEVWFQNRRARTKLKKTEMDYEYLKRCCHMLTLENRRLQREVAELRMLRKNSDQHPFYMHINPSFCLSCKRTNVSSSASVATVTFDNQPNSFATILSKRT